MCNVWNKNIKKYFFMFLLLLAMNPLFSETIKSHPFKRWSILICTLEERKTSFERLYKKLMHQIESCGLEKEIEILWFLDNREASVGYKRNFLLQASRGEYINFIDDDDDIHDNYIGMIYEKLKKGPDCVSLLGIITTDNRRSKKFIHSIRYKTYFEKSGVYFRPPNHLNPIKRSIAIQFPFPDKYFGEDTDWAMQIARSGLIKTEGEIKVPYYFYNFTSRKH